MKNSKEILLVAVAITAAAFISTTAKAQDKERQGPRAGGPRPIEMIIEHRQDLGLTDDQVAKLKAVQEANRPQLQAIHDDKSLSREQRRDKVEAIMKDSKAKIEAILTPEQQKKLKEMRGKGMKDRRPHDGPPPAPESN